MASTFTLRIRDYNSEYSAARFTGVDVNAGNFAAQDALRTTLEAALAPILIGNIAERQVLAIKANVNDVVPASPFAQRETKWLVKYTDNVTGKAYQLELPTADLSNLVTNGSTLDVAPGSQGEDFVNAFEAYQRSLGVNAVTFVEAIHVGRNI